MNEKPIYCVTCCSPLPAGQDHPRFFLQGNLRPDPTDVHGLHEELDFVLAGLRTLSNTLLERESDRAEQQQSAIAQKFPTQSVLPGYDPVFFGLFDLLLNCVEEAARRAMRLRNAGLYWQSEDRNDESLFPDVPSPHTEQQAERAEPSPTSPSNEEAPSPSSGADTWETYNAHDAVMGRIQALLHGTYASREYWDDKHAELAMVTMAEKLCEEARTLGSALYEAYRGERQPTPQTRKEG